MTDESSLTNHQITIALAGGAMLGPFKATWTKAGLGDVRELTKEFDSFLKGGPQKRFKYHLHDPDKRVSHSLVLNFEQVAAIYDRVQLSKTRVAS